MDEFPGNSKSEKDSPPNADKKVKKVVEHGVIRRKKPLGKRFAETFVQGDARGVWGYVLFDVLLPAARDTVADAVSQGVERMLFGEARSTSRRTGRSPGGPNGYISYSRYSGSATRSEGRRDEPRMSRRDRASHNFGELIFKTRAEASEVLDNLNLLVGEYDQATVADLYGLCGEQADYTDDRYGWTDLRSAEIQRVRDGYLLDMPRPFPLTS